MKVFVLGGTGAIGRHVVPTLVREGHEVTALARTPEKADALTKQGTTAVSVSMFDRSALSSAFAGHDAVVNVTSAIPPMTQFMRSKAWRKNNRVRTEGSAAVVDAAMAAGVGRVLQESVSMLYPDCGARWIDEDVAIDTYPISMANIVAETNANRFSAAGGVGIVLRFGLFYGPGAKHSEQFLGLARRHICVVMGPPDTYISSIHVADGASAVAAALHVPAGTYNIVDDEPLTKREYARAMEEAVHKKSWLRAPGRAGLLFGDRVTSLTRSSRVSNKRFRTTAGWAPRYPSAREGYKAMAEGAA